MNGGALAAQMAEFEVAASCSNNAVRSIGRGYRYERNSADNPFSNSFLPQHVSCRPGLPPLSLFWRSSPSAVDRVSIPRRVSIIPLSISPLGSPSLFLLRALEVEQPSFVLVSLSIRLPSSLRRVCSGAHLVPEVKRGGIVAPVVLGTTTSLLLRCVRRRAPVDRDSNQPELSVAISHTSHRSHFGLIAPESTRELKSLGITKNNYFDAMMRVMIQVIRTL